MADTFFWGSDIFSRATRWLLVNTGTTFNLVLPLLLLLFGLALGQSHSQNCNSNFVNRTPMTSFNFSGGIFLRTWRGWPLQPWLAWPDWAGWHFHDPGEIYTIPKKLYNATIKGRRIFDEEFSECRNKHREHGRTCRASKQKSGSARWAKSLL